MAITIISDISPYIFYQTTTPIILEVRSTNTAQPGFQFVAEVYFGPTKVATLQKPAFVTTNKTYFDIRPILADYIDFAFSPALTDTYSPNFLYFQIAFGEYYNDTYYLNLAYSGVSTVFPSSVNYQDYILELINPSAYTLLGTSSKFLSNMTTRTVTDDSTSFLYGFAPLVNIDTIKIECYDSDGVFIKDDDIAFSQGTQIFSIGVGPQNIKTSLGSPNYFNGVSYYNISVYAGATRRSQYYRFNITDRCTRFDTYTLHFQNEMGGFDSQIFTLLSRDTYETNKQSYKLNEYGYSTSGLNYYRQTNKVYYSEEKNIIELNTDFLTDTESDLLRFLFNSHDTWCEKDGVYFPVKVNDTSYVKKTVNNDDLIQYKVTIEKTYTNKKW